MSTTLGALKVRLSLLLQDPSNHTFTDGLLAELLFAAVNEVSLIAPRRFQEDLDPVTDQFTYQLLTSDFSTAEPEIEVMRVEVWDASSTPDQFLFSVNSASTENVTGDAGYVNWEGQLTLPSRVVRGLTGHETAYIIKVWGYAPYPMPVSDDDVIDMSELVEQATLVHARMEGLELLNAERDLFTQWQTRSGNTDMSPAALLNQLSMARQNWRIYSRKIMRLRAPV